MSRKRIISAVSAWLMCVCIVGGSIGCLMTGMGLAVESVSLLALICMLIPAVFCLFAQLPKLRFLPFVLAALSALYILYDGAVILEIEVLLYRISRVYDSMYACGTIRWHSLELLRGMSMDLAIYFVAGILAALCSGLVQLKWGNLASAIIALIPLLLCMGVPGTNPDPFWLFLLLSGLLLMAMTTSLRRKNRTEGQRLIAIMLIPVMLVSWLLFAVATPERYVSQSSSLGQQLSAWLYQLPMFNKLPPGQLGGYGDGAVREAIDLSATGSRVQLHVPVMDVIAESTGTLYLRGQVYDTYDQRSWTIAEESYDTVGWTDSDDMVSAGLLYIRTRSVLPLLYHPYYPTSLRWYEQLSDGCLPNTGGSAGYSYTWLVLREKTLPDNPGYLPPGGFVTGDLITDWPLDGVGTIPLPEDAKAHFLHLPDTTASWAVPYANELLSGVYGPVQERAKAIVTAVSQAAPYSLNVSPLPIEETDFARWFLEEGERGYCVHFATAATVLLRAAGVPARYVTGYAVSVEAGKVVTVTSDEAHAWVEYYDDYYGCWRVLDPTPGNGTTNPGGAIEPEVELPEDLTEPTDPTEPEEEITQPETQPTEPETEPTEDEPSEPTAAAPTETLPQTDTPEDTRDYTLLLKLLLWIGIAGGILGLLWLQYALRRQLRRKKLYTGSPNAMALARWREALRYSRSAKCKPTKQLRELAEKARFSRHTMTKEELAVFDRHLSLCADALRDQPWYLRILWMLVLAIE